MCSECNIKFIGPDYTSIELMGNKAKARELMKSAGVPVVPGYEGIIENENHALNIAKSIGYPIMIKAAAGGGGKGIRVVRNDEEFKKGYNTAKAESLACFNDDTLYIEKFIENPRHIEFQILADEYGNIVHLGERECSLQRKNQKVLEEAPSSILSEKLRMEMGEIAKKAAKACDYKNAGTIEFLVDKDFNYYFMEMNTRIQVEHPITENAEDPENDFRPCPGIIDELYMPGGLGIRLDSAIYCGYKIPHCYDSMLAKLIAYGENREESIVRMKRALSEFGIGGVKTNIEFQYSILEMEEFLRGDYDTGFLGNKMVEVYA